jgi:hypothetical protein
MSIAAVNGETGGHENEQTAPEEPTMVKPQTLRANVLSCILRGAVCTRCKNHYAIKLRAGNLFNIQHALHHPRNPSSVIEVSVEFCSFSLIIDNI